MENKIDLTPILDRIGLIVELKAKELVPFDLGRLSASIHHKVEGDSVIIYSDCDYAQDMEYGTPPNVLDAKEKEELGKWAERKGFSEAGKRGVIRKIQKEGIKVGTVENPLKNPVGRFRPFLRPAIHQSIPLIKSEIKRMLG